MCECWWESPSRYVIYVPQHRLQLKLSRLNKYARKISNITFSRGTVLNLLPGIQTVVERPLRHKPIATMIVELGSRTKIERILIWQNSSREHFVGLQCFTLIVRNRLPIKTRFNIGLWSQWGWMSITPTIPSMSMHYLFIIKYLVVCTEKTRHQHKTFFYAWSLFYWNIKWQLIATAP